MNPFPGNIPITEMSPEELECFEKRREAMNAKAEEKDELIEKLGKGDMFGEIGLLTSLRRTCTVKTVESSLMMTLTSEGLKNI